MTTEHSTYTYEDGRRETVTLLRGSTTPPGHALLRITRVDGSVSGYVNTAWLRDRADDLEPHLLTPDAITDESVERAQSELLDTAGLYVSRSSMRDVLIAALTEPPARPEGAEDMDNDMRLANAAALSGALDPGQRRALADHLAAFGYRKEA